MKWEHYLRTFQTLMAGGLEDPMVLTLLKQSLDEVTRRQLERATERNRHLTYSQFWEMLSEQFGDIGLAHRQAWQQVKVELPLTSDRWNSFRRTFELYRDRVEDWMPSEERELLLKQLGARDWQGGSKKDNIGHTILSKSHKPQWWN